MNKSLSATLALSTLALAISTPAHAAGLTTLSEGFENVSGLAPAWAFVNNSNPAPTTGPGTAIWSQGVTAITNYAAQSGSSSSFAAVDFTSTAGDPLTQANGTVSNWLITPELDFTNGGTFSFYARTLLGNSRPEYIEVRQSSAGSSTNVGTTATSVGDFTTLVGSVGSLNDPFVFPGGLSSNTQWGFFTFSILPTDSSGRLAFRYFATDGGVNGTQNLYVTIDTVNYTVVPEPSSMAGILVIGGLGAAARLRNKAKKAQA
jgi:hypothetical protein